MVALPIEVTTAAILNTPRRCALMARILRMGNRNSRAQRGLLLALGWGVFRKEEVVIQEGGADAAGNRRDPVTPVQVEVHHGEGWPKRAGRVHRSAGYHASRENVERDREANPKAANLDSLAPHVYGRAEDRRNKQKRENEFDHQ